ncbi:glycosyltransferase family 2 protein [Porticoccaceae bacterium]|nr:glycosyltransferase family 2 protein [Porticoccaceae bacterium]
MNPLQTISFCITCRNRLWQLQQTLPSNLAAISTHPNIELTLVDFGSNDGLDEWVWQHFGDAIAQGKLRFFQVEGRPVWNCARAKNLAHRIAKGSYLFNLDADNFIQASDIQAIEQAANDNRVVHQWSGQFGDGTPGRIGLPSSLFFALGGYDEGMLAMGMQDIDLLHRCERTGHQPLRIAAPEQPAVSNTLEEKMRECQPVLSGKENLYHRMLEHNRERSALRLELHGPVIEDNFAPISGKLNDRPCRLGANEKAAASP